MIQGAMTNDPVTRVQHTYPGSAAPDSTNIGSPPPIPNARPVEAEDPVPPQKAQDGSAESVNSASSLIASLPVGGERAPQQTGAMPRPEQALSARSLPTSDAATGGVQVARMIDGMNWSEMHIDLRTQDFGSVEVHTILRESKIGLSVGSEKGDLRGFLVPEVPSLQAVIHQQDLRLDTLHFLDHSGRSTAQFSGGGDRQSYSQSRNESQAPAISGIEESPEEGIPQEIGRHGKTGLSVHA